MRQIVLRVFHFEVFEAAGFRAGRRRRASFGKVAGGGGLEEEVDPKKTRKEERDAERGKRATGGELLTCTGGGLGF